MRSTKGDDVAVLKTTAYGAAALGTLARVVARLKGDDPMRLVTILTPDNLTATVARRHLAHGLDGTPGVAALDLTTLPRLAERLAAHLLAPRRPLTTPVLAAAWRRALRQDPGVFAPVAEHPATVQALARAHRQLRTCSAAGLDAVAGGPGTAPDLIRLHREVTGALADRWYDAEDLVRTAATAAGRVGDPVVLYLPQALTPGEQALVRALDEATELTVVVGLTGAPRADAAVRAGVQRLAPTPGDRLDLPTAGRVLTASDSDDEVRCVVREVVARLGSTPAHRVAVLHGAERPYARLLHEHLGAAGIAVNGPGTRPLHERAVARWLLEVLALTDGDVPRGDLFRALANAPTRDFDGGRVPLATWERMSRTAGVLRGDDWDQRLARRAEDLRAQAAVVDPDRPWLVDRQLRDAEVAERLRLFAVRLRGELSAAADLTTWHDLAHWCLRLLTTLVGEPAELSRLPVEEQDAAATVITMLRGLPALDGVDAGASLSALRDVLELELATAVPRVGRFGEGVLVAPISAAVGLEADVVFLVGLAEDLYPGRTSIDALLPDPVRALAATELRSGQDRLLDKHRHLLAAFQAAPEVVASFPRGDLRRSSQRLPSRWLLPTLRGLSGTEGLAATDWEKAAYGDALATSSSFAGELLRTRVPATEQEWRARALSADPADSTALDPVSTAALALREGRRAPRPDRFDGVITGEPGLPSYATEDFAVSPTALEHYASCPFGFFVQRLLRVSPVEQPEDAVTISPADLGNLVHASVDRLVREAAEAGALPRDGAPWTLGQHSRLLEIAAEVADDYEARGLTGHPRLWHPLRARLMDDLAKLLAEDDAWRAPRRLTVVASELAFGMHGAEPVEVPVPGGRVRLRGSVDLVDVAPDGRLFVLDLKTGKPDSYKGISQEDPVVRGSRLQLPVYAYAARAAQQTPAAPVTAQYWFVRTRPDRIELELTEAVETVYAATLATLVGSIAAGLFPSRPPAGDDYGYVQCWYCNPDGIGYGEQRDRWKQKQSDPALRDYLTLVDPDTAATLAALDGSAPSDTGEEADR